MGHVGAWIFLLSLVLVPFAGAEDRPVAGRVIDASTNLPLAGARVTGAGAPGVSLAVTGSDGRFSLSLPAAASALHITADGFRPLVVPLPTDGDRDAPRDLELRLVRVALRHEEHIVVTPARQERGASDLPYAVAVVDGARLAERLPRSTPEALADAPGILLQKTNHGSGSPYLRGLVGNQVLVLVDGIRLNNSTFRYGPNQYLATIDPGTIERIEVVRGAGAVPYGSDAMGGVINIVTRRARLGDGPLRLSGEVSGKAMSSGMEQGGRIEGGAASSRSAVRGGVSLRNFGDLLAGGRLGVERPSGYGEVSGDASAAVSLGGAGVISVAYQQLKQSDVPRFDQVAQRGFDRYAFDPQARQLLSGNWRLARPVGPLAAVEATVARHHTRERRERRARGASVLVTEQDTVNTWSASVDAQLRPIRGWMLSAGLDATRDHIGSGRRDVNDATGVVTPKRGLYPDGARASSVGAFVSGAWSRRALYVDVGGRFSRYAVSARDATFGAIDIAPAAFVGSAAARYELAPAIEIVGSVGQSFRAPNVDDVSTLGAFDYGIEVPSPDLSPERAVTTEGGVRGRLTSRAAFSATVFRTSLGDLIDRVASSYLGSSVLEGQSVYRKVNVADATVRGIELEAEWRLSDSLRASGHLTATHGEQGSTGQPMRRIPPVNGRLAVRWEGTSELWVEGQLRGAGAQRRLASGDIADHRIPPGGTPGWWVLDLLAGRRLGKRLHVSAGLVNLLDEAYRVHGSGIDGYGRSGWIATRVSF
jgi:outer membrane receptor protein involved in Fe transport